MSVLKGPAASALYGSRASHGVILITTKRANAKEHFSLERSEEHTSELQSRFDLVCRLLLEKKKKNKHNVKEISNNNT